jgi:hypothetical protein
MPRRSRPSWCPPPHRPLSDLGRLGRTVAAKPSL